MITMANATVARADHRVEFRGIFTITKLNAGCKAIGWFLGDNATSRFKPPDLGHNNSDTVLSIFFRYFGETYELVGGALDDAFQVVDGVGLGFNGPYFFESDMRLISMKTGRQDDPGMVTEDTSYVTMKGQIKRFDGTADCKITFKATYSRRVP